MANDTLLITPRPPSPASACCPSPGDIKGSAAAPSLTYYPPSEPFTGLPLNNTHAIHATKLDESQFKRLHDLLHSNVFVNPHPTLAHTLPTLNVRLKDVVSRIRDELINHNIVVRGVRINGGAANHVLLHRADYNDLDLIFFVKLGSSKDMERIKHIVMETIVLIFLKRFNASSNTRCAAGVGPTTKEPDTESVISDSSTTSSSSNCNSISNSHRSSSSSSGKGSSLDLPSGVGYHQAEQVNQEFLREAYIHKMVKVCSGGDLWSLLALNNDRGRNLELKFVASMKRQFEFSVDSFQIILDPLLDALQNNFFDDDDQQYTGETEDDIFRSGSNTSPQDTHPTTQPIEIVCESVYGNFGEALEHLKNKLIATLRPEEIRGGGLLKYCNLLVQGYTPAPSTDVKSLEKYMCSRFFIDFGDLRKQENKLDSYLRNHFTQDHRTLYSYLVTLYRVVDSSTVCLMGHERREILRLIENMFFNVPYHYPFCPTTTTTAYPKFHPLLPTFVNIISSNTNHHQTPCCSSSAKSTDQEASKTISNPTTTTTTTTDLLSPKTTSLNQIVAAPAACPLYISSGPRYHHAHHPFAHQPIYCSYQHHLVSSPPPHHHYFQYVYVPVYTSPPPPPTTNAKSPHSCSCTQCCS